MKRLIFLLYAFMTITASAGEWRTEITKADILLGWEVDFVNHIYQDSTSYFIWRSDQPDQFTIISPNIFDTEMSANGRVGAVVRVGLYDEYGKLLEHFTMWLRKSNNRGTKLSTFNLGYMSNPTGQDTKVRKIMKQLSKDSGGYVRIVADTFDEGIFDLHIYPNPAWF